MSGVTFVVGQPPDGAIVLPFSWVARKMPNCYLAVIFVVALRVFIRDS